LGVHSTEKWRDRETYKRKDKEDSSNEENVEHWRKNIQRQFRKENEDVQFFNGKPCMARRCGIGRQ